MSERILLPPRRMARPGPGAAPRARADARAPWTEARPASLGTAAGSAAPAAPAPAAAPLRRPRVMAVSSGGGHWVELRRVQAAFAGADVFYVSTDASAAVGLGARHYAIRSVSRRDRLGFAVVAWQLARILLRERPDAVVTTGAAPGVVALALAKTLLRARTIWIDSIASADTPSLSARLARPVADAWLVQWPHLARPEGPDYWGAVL